MLVLILSAFSSFQLLVDAAPAHKTVRSSSANRWMLAPPSPLVRLKITSRFSICAEECSAPWETESIQDWRPDVVSPL